LEDFELVSKPFIGIREKYEYNAYIEIEISKKCKSDENVIKLP
jgi:hypothetical protein